MKRREKAIDYYGGCEGPLGFPMRAAVAKQLEQMLAAIPRDCKDFIDQHGTSGIVRRKFAPVGFELKPDARQDVSLITTDAVDLDKEALFPEGADWRYFELNGGQVTWCHEYGLLPVGRSLWRRLMPKVKIIDRVGDAWAACTEYHAKPDEWTADDGPFFPNAVWLYVRYFDLRGKSVGFIPTTMRKPTQKDIDERPWLAEANWVIPSWVPLEYAVTPIQCQPEAVVVTVAKARALGIETPTVMLKSFGIDTTAPASPEPETRTLQPSAPGLTRGEIRAALARARREALAELPATIKDALDVMRGRV